MSVVYSLGVSEESSHLFDETEYSKGLILRKYRALTTNLSSFTSLVTNTKSTNYVNSSLWAWVTVSFNHKKIFF